MYIACLCPNLVSVNGVVDQWPQWKRRFEECRSATALDAESETRLVSVLLYCMGKTAGDVLMSTKISEEDRKKYSSVLSKFDEFFDVRRNVILERAKFNRRNQLAGESSELQDGDRSANGSMDTLKAETEKGRRCDRGQDKSGRPRRPQPRRRSNAKPKCTRCGEPPHNPGDRCPASTAICHKCNKKGHFQAQCFSKTTAHTNELTTDSVGDTAFLGVINSQRDSFWLISALVGNKPTAFKLDTGAQVTAMSEKTYKGLELGPLKKPSKVLYGPTGEPLDVLGQVTAKITVGSKGSRQTIFVVRGLRRALMGLPAIKSLNVAKQIREVVERTDIKQQFPKVFTGLGNLGEEYCIKLREGAVPYSLFTPWNVSPRQSPKRTGTNGGYGCGLKSVPAHGVVCGDGRGTQTFW